jgi:hypothetical protein
MIKFPTYKLPVNYTELATYERKLVREQYIRQQDNICIYCKISLTEQPPSYITNKPIDCSLFPPNFLKHRVHLQHNHSTGMTEGAVHAYCNAVMWQYEGK